MLYTGIDLHKDNCFLTTINEAADIVSQEIVRNEETEILNYFFSQGNSHKAVVESTSNWYWLSDLLTNHGIELSLAHAKYLKAIAYAKVKTDKVDSLTLSLLLRMNMIPEAHQITGTKRNLRDLTRARLRLTQKRTSCINSVDRILEKFNIPTPQNAEFVTLDSKISILELPDFYKFQIKCFHEQYQLIERQIGDLEKMIEPILIQNEDIRRLRTIPGFGNIISSSIYLEIYDIDRFANEKKLFSYARIVPGAENSNRKKRNKSGNKDGNRYLKLAFTEAAVQAIRHYPDIRKFYKNKLRKKHKSIARNLVAIELAKIAYHVLKDKTVCTSFKGQPLSNLKPLKRPRLASPIFILDQ